MARAGLTPERVVDGAAALADEIGLEHLTLAAVAQRFGVALPSLYKHVSGSDGLQRALAVLGMRQLAAAMTGAAVGRAGKDALVAVSHAYRGFATSRPGLYAATMRAPDPDDEEHSAVSRQALDVAVAIVRGYGITGSDAVHAIRMFRSALHGFVAQEASGAFGLPDSVEHSFALMVEALDVALVGWPTLRAPDPAQEGRK